MGSISRAGIVALLLLISACGGGSGSSSVAPPSIGGSFAADQASPGPGEVALAQQSISGALVEIRVDVSGVDDLFGASFDLIYDPSMVEYVSDSPGTLLETGGAAARYEVNDGQPGTLVIAATRVGINTPGVDVSGTQMLMRLTFRVLKAGTSSVTFRSPALLDDQLQPQPIAGIDWFGGSLTGI